ncbi:MAG: PilZ domain-containing protein [Candidatus Omnitrophica bacterium]|nr:PilZ domain-containing protein [Candidatus Omnitrophota bacterium]
MFTKKDYREYFEQISVLERGMIYAQYRLKAQTDDTRIISVCDTIIEDEVKHYRYARFILESFFFDDADERRLYQRRFCIGDMTMMAAGRDRPVSARCIDISPAGLGFEGDEPLYPGADITVSMESYNGKVSVKCQARIVWMKPLTLVPPKGEKITVFLGGMQFKTIQDV